MDWSGVIFYIIDNLPVATEQKKIKTEYFLFFISFYFEFFVYMHKTPLNVKLTKIFLPLYGFLVHSLGCFLGYTEAFSFMRHHQLVVELNS